METTVQNNSNDDKVVWISVSSLAKILGKTTQTVYNQIKQGKWETQRFARGTMNGILVKYVKS